MYKGLKNEYEKNLSQGKILVLCISCGRSGTRWLSQIFDRHKNASGSCERLLEEAFYRYVKCNKLPIDVNGIMDLIKDGIVQDWEKTDISFVASHIYLMIFRIYLRC